MIDPSRLIYLHGLESSSQSGKARLFAEKFPGMLTPDFKGSFDERMEHLLPILGESTNWTIIGSSFGGLMATVFCLDHTHQVEKLILLAPALNLPPVSSRQNIKPTVTPTTLIHGRADTIVPLDPIREIAQKIFTNLTLLIVDDDHRLHKTFNELSWESILD